MSPFYADSNLWNKQAVFKDRFEAGQRLGVFMADQMKGRANCLVLAIPAGGVPVGIELSRELMLPFDCLIVRKIQIPGNTEAGFGAVASGGEALVNRELVHRLGLSQDEVRAQTHKVHQELETRERLFRDNKPLPDLSGKQIILTDDGLASGYTMLAAIETVRSKGADKVIVAVPTAPLSSVRRVEREADAVYSLHVQEAGPFAVASAYQDWYDLSRDQVVALLQTLDQEDPDQAR